jgi:membrane protein required for colicin V production
MNWVDWAIVVILLLSIVYGLTRGLLVQIATFAGGLLGLAIAKSNYQSVTDFLASFVPKTHTLTIIAYLLIVLLVWLLIGIGAQSIRTLLRLTVLGCLDRLGGALFGIVQGLLLIEVLVWLGGGIHNSTIRAGLHDSHLAPMLRDALPHLHHLMPKHIWPPPR